ncbi:MAG: hypothetical protein IKZ34_03540 [Alphaproteobacteria bacterium]|nr:hypothetical protein [Alphaproteobacteria bacterium]
MKLFKRFLLLALLYVPCVAGAQVATTAGSNLTAWNGNTGATNNNNWNTLMNNRASNGGGAVADFGNCNSLILRCAQPKCSGCTSMDIARPIVEGCVNSNKDCKKHGEDLIQFISGQIVANANAKVQEKQLAAQQAAAQQAAAQSSQQIQQMQMQMQQMQQQMQAQNAQQMASMQAALEEQKELVAQAQAEAAAAQQAKMAAETAPGVTVAQQVAIDAGVSEDVLVRQQITGQIMTEIENAEDALHDLKSKMLIAFEYAGCDTRGNNCRGPKRVKIFKDKAREFFDPYNNVLDSLYDALITAQAVGVDITDIYLLLSNSCNSWGEYLCSDTITELYEEGQNCKNGKSIATANTKGQHECADGHAIPPQDSPACRLNKILSNNADVQQGLLFPEEGNGSMIRVGCASASLDASGLFANRKKQTSIDIDILQRILEQDAPTSCKQFGNTDACNDKSYFTKYCGVGKESYPELQKIAATKKLPKNICINENVLGNYKDNSTVGGTDNESGAGQAKSCENRYSPNQKLIRQCICQTTRDVVTWNGNSCECEDGQEFSYLAGLCVQNKNDKDKKIVDACIDSGGEFKSEDFSCKCNKEGQEVVGNQCRCKNGYEDSEDRKSCKKAESN